MADPYRILVTGSRSWCASNVIYEALNQVACDTRIPLVVVHGGAMGADALASTWARVNAEGAVDGCKITEEEHVPDWGRHGKRAGFIRNAEMVAAGADICLAFIAPCTVRYCRPHPHGSHGAEHCAAIAAKAGIVVRRFTSP